MPPRRAASTSSKTKAGAPSKAKAKKRAVVESSDDEEDEEQETAIVKKERESDNEDDDDSDDDDSDEQQHPVKKKAPASRKPPPAKAPSKSTVNNTRKTATTTAKRTTKAKVEPVEEQQQDSSDEEDAVSTAQPERREASASASSTADQTFQDARQDSEDEEQDEDVKPPPPGQGPPAPTSANGQDDASSAASASSRASSPAPSTPAADDDHIAPGLQTSQPTIVAAEEDNEDDLLQATIQPAIVPAKVVVQPIIDEGPKKRLVIHKLVLVNFKSYAGRQEIGPFHKSFSSIVGPNGSGKSNTIDALLFVFGFKATKMRQGKLSELIHNSEGTEDIDSCSVEVWFREIIDLPGPDDYEIVPNSTLVVAREASRNNSSKYTINKKNSTYKEVQTLLKGRGIDLDHKRFLILQGEVESIAQMKPKAPNEHEDGLLEYLEDIIGTSSYKEPIAEYLKQVDELNEQRTEKTNRVKLVEREKSALEAAKKEADGYLRDQNELIHRQNELYQLYQHTYQHNITVATDDVQNASAALEREQSEQAGIRHEVQELENEHKQLLSDVNQLEKHMTEVSKELVAFEKEDVQMQEKRKHLSTKLKKLKKSIQDDSHAKSEASSSFKNYSEDIEKLRDEISVYEKNLAKEEAELEKICDGLKDKTSVFTKQIDVLQNELQPWLDKVGSKNKEINLKKNERDLLKEKSESVKKNLEEAESMEKEVRRGNEELEEKLDGYSKEKLGVEKKLDKLRAELERITSQDQKARTTASAARAKVEEAKASQAASRSKGDVLSSLTKLKDQGRLNDFYGRLGNLGRIDDKYDVAISTACGALDNLVCETVAGGQACLEVLRRNNLGRATILCLKALNKRDLKPIQTPENVPRLFDLVTPKDPIFAPAFYQVLQNTLVADNLAQANRIAFGGSKRWRVVTLDGKLIDVSGTMSGGGNRVARGGMSSKFSSDEEATPEAIARLEKDTTKAEDAVKVLSEEKQEKEKEYNELQKKIPEIEMNVSKTEMAVRAGKKRIEEAQKRIQELKGQNKQPQGDDVKRIAALEKDIEALTNELWALEEKRDKIQSDIKSLQDKILEVGGVRLRSQQVKVEGIKEMSDHANDQLTKAEVGKAKAEKDLVKLEKNLKVNALAVSEMEEDLAALEKSIKEKSNALEHVRKNVEDAKEVLEEKTEELAEMKALLDEKQTEMNKFRVKEAELAEKVKAAKGTLADNTKSLQAVIKMLEKLELHDIEEDGDDEDEQAGKNPDQPQQEKPADVLQVLSEEDLERLDAGALKGQIAVLEERIQQAKPNLAVLKEYKRREKEFLDRAQELERVTQERDATKQKYDDLRKQRLEEFMVGFQIISMKLKEMYQMITMGGNAELELVDSLDPFSEGIIFSVMPPKKSWKNISNLSGGEKTLSSLALVFALHVYKPTPLYFMDEIDAALDFRNVSIVGHYLKERTRNAQFIIISLRNNCFELAARLVGIYKVNNRTRSVVIDNHELSQIEDTPALVR